MSGHSHGGGGHGHSHSSKAGKHAVAQKESEALVDSSANTKPPTQGSEDSDSHQDVVIEFDSERMCMYAEFFLLSTFFFSLLA